MKKILLSLLLVALLTPAARAQFTDFGMRTTFGISSFTDDITHYSPVFGANIGGFINYKFLDVRSYWARHFFLEGGFNLVRRGAKFDEHTETGLDLCVTEGYYHAYGVQLTALACWRQELPVRQAGHYIRGFIGPGFTFGVVGNYRVHRVHPFRPNETENYDNYVDLPKESRRVFRYISRPDVNVVAGVGYQRMSWAIDLYVDHGFIAVNKTDDALRTLEREQLENGVGGTTTTKGFGIKGGNNNGNNNNNDNNHKPLKPEDIITTNPGGNNTSLMLSVCYRIPIHQKPKGR